MLGVDIVPIERLREVLARSTGMEERLFTARERAYCARHEDPVRHLAGTLAAKEAVIKACRLGALASFARRIEVSRDHDGAPTATVIGCPQHRTTLSISHDGGVAVAVAISESIEVPGEETRSKRSSAPPAAARAGNGTSKSLRPNIQLANYIQGVSGLASGPDPRALVEAARLPGGTDFP